MCLLPSSAIDDETQAVKFHLAQLFQNFGDLDILYLIQVALNGGLHGKSPNANVLAKLLESEKSSDFSRLRDDEVREIVNNFLDRKSTRAMAPSALKHIEEYFGDVDTADTCQTNPKLWIVVECGEEVLQQGI